VTSRIYKFPPDFLTRPSLESVCGIAGNILQNEMPVTCIIPANKNGGLFGYLFIAIDNKIGFAG
jgi:hypothetical protein